MWKMWFFTKNMKILRKNRQKCAPIDAAHREASNGGIFNLCAQKFEEKIEINQNFRGVSFFCPPPVPLKDIIIQQILKNECINNMISLQKPFILNH